GYLQFQSSLEKTEVTSNKQTSFSPECMFVVPRTSLKPDTYVATVILVEEGKHHPINNSSITFQIDLKPTLLANVTSKFIQPASLKKFSSLSVGSVCSDLGCDMSSGLQVQ
ncbi:hypothetical protein BgiBS90_019163, partial [Biomphalaria glabrata]